MKRSDLAWALGAVLPHVGTTKGPYVGIDRRDGKVYAYATDTYTAGVARIPHGGMVDDFWRYAMSKSEAQDLMRFVRPTKKAHDAEDLTVRAVGMGLHVATAEDSAVFDLVSDNPVTLDLILDLIRATAGLPEMYGIIQQPSLAAKFAKAQRYDTDRLRIYPAVGQRDVSCATLTVGEHFIGNVAGLTYEPSEVLESFGIPWRSSDAAPKCEHGEREAHPWVVTTAQGLNAYVTDAGNCPGGA
jgi:hypothetical protein